MNQISAAENHTILTDDSRWRMLHNERPLVEAARGRFRYGTRFANTRRLPQDGELAAQEIDQVVLGWQQTDESWHLGLVLKAPLADQRGSRWVELVYWPDPEITVFQDLAQVTGQRLADALGITLYVIPPRPVEPPPPPRELPPLPLHLGDWRMERAAADKPHYVIQRQASWRLRQLGRIAWYVLWALVYALLSWATLVSDIALPNAGTLIPNPQYLPYLGLATAVLLLGRAIYQTWLLLRLPNRIFIDGNERTLSVWKDDHPRWTLNAAEIQSIFASEIVKKNAHPPATEYGELNVHLGGGEFRNLLLQEQALANDQTPQPQRDIPRTEEIRELARDIVHTDLQAAAVYIAETLQQPNIWYDLRVK